MHRAPLAESGSCSDVEPLCVPTQDAGRQALKDECES